MLDGYIFAPSADVFLQDHGGGITATGLVANTLFDKTTPFTVALDYDKENSATTLNKAVIMVE